MTPEELYRIRHGRAHTQRELADVLGVAGNTVARWERGERAIPRWVDCSLTLWQELNERTWELARAKRDRERLHRRLKKALKLANARTR